MIKKKFDLKATVGLALGGIPAVLIAAYIVKTLDLYYVRWLVVIVVVYTALSMLRSAMVERQAAVACPRLRRPVAAALATDAGRSRIP